MRSKSAVRNLKKKEVRKHPALALEPAEKQPEYNVQVSDPKMIRRDLLEGLREIIIFMQGYEKFRSIQEEKVATFTTLKSDLKELNRIVDRLRRCFPKGKLKPVTPLADELSREESKGEEEEAEPEKKVALPEARKEYSFSKPSQGELDQLESQLKDIEKELGDMGSG